MGAKTILLIVATIVGFGALRGYAQDRGEGRGQGMSLMQASPILSAIDGNHDGVISGDEIANAPARLRTLDKNKDGKLTPDEVMMQMGGGRGPRGRGGEDEAPPIAGPSADELLATLLTYDKNKDGKLDKSEVPARLQGMFDRGDSNRDGVLDGTELRALAAEQAAASGPGEGPGGEGRGGREGRGPGGPGRGSGGPGGGFSPFDLAAAALDANHDGEISAAEIDNAATSLRTLDKNGDGRITEDEVRPAFGGRGGQ
jgi:Ca2+-binding EF-hand superfamily protein